MPEAVIVDAIRTPIGRNAALLAGIDHHVPATTVNRFCASSLQTIRMAFHAIKAGEGDQYVAAGVEAVIVPVGEVTRDDGPRAGTTLEKLAELKPVFDPENGTVTAGNSCPLNDGPAAVLVMSEEKANALGLKPRARIVASSGGMGMAMIVERVN